MSNGTENRFRISAENARLLLVAFFIALVMWLFAKSGDTEQARIQVPVLVTIDGKPPDEDRIELRVNPSRIPLILRYPKGMQPYISSENFRFEIEAAEILNELGLDWKTISQPLNERALVANIPEAQRVSPVKIGRESNTVEVRMRWNAQPAIVEPEVVGADRLPEGFQLVTPVNISPKEVWIVGDDNAIERLPRDELTNKLKLKTERLNVADKTQSALETVRIVLPPEIDIIRPESQLVEVNLEIQEVQTIREIRGIPLNFQAINPEAVSLDYKEKTATVTVFGPPSLLRQLTPESFEVTMLRPAAEVPGTSKEVSLEAHFSANVTPEVRSRLVIRSVNPKTIRVKYVAKSPES